MPNLPLIVTTYTSGAALAATVHRARTSETINAATRDIGSRENRYLLVSPVESVDFILPPFTSYIAFVTARTNRYGMRLFCAPRSSEFRQSNDEPPAA